MSAQNLLFRWLDPRLDAPASAWLRSQCALLADGAPDKTLYLAFGLALRHVGREPLNPAETEQAEARAFHPGWDLRDWTRDQAARAALLLSLPPTEQTARVILALHQSADLGEHVALVRALFLLPGAGDVLHVAREGIRSNMGDVFRAISQRNPYPAERFDDIAWNQMVAKCVFTDLPLRGVHGLDRRANAPLARMLIDLVRERRAAHRAISPEVWRCVAPFMEGADFDLAREALNREGPDRRAAALGLWAVPDGAGKAILEAGAPELTEPLRSGILNWENYDQA